MHVLIVKAWGTQCRVCRRWARTDAQTEKLDTIACRPIADDIADHDPKGRIHISHHLVFHPTGTVWCDRCGSYADRMLKNLQFTCLGFLSRSGVAARSALMAGRHPRTGELLSEAAAPGHRVHGSGRRALPSTATASGWDRDYEAHVNDDGVIFVDGLDPHYLSEVAPGGFILDNG